MRGAGRAAWLAVSAGLVLVVSACTSTSPPDAATPQSQPAPDGMYRRGGAAAGVRGPLAGEIPDAFSSVDAGWEHTCALRADSTVVCRPQSYHAQGGLWTLPADSLEYRTERVVALPAGLFTAVSDGGEHSCGLRRDGTVACWGGSSRRPPILADDGRVPGVTTECRTDASWAPLGNLHRLNLVRRPARQTK
jgi:hypothetical protein